MSSMLRTRFGIPGAIATIALLFAMSGGAFAAKYLITSTKQISPSVLKKLKGNAGAAGPAGAPGAQGPQGPAGPAGPAGANGEKGATGATGVTGKAGVDGETGFTETLPSEMTETGVWNYNYTPPPESGVDSENISLTFNIRLAAPITEAANVTYVSGAAPENCENTEYEGVASAANPEADPGNLCVYQAFASGVIIGEITDPSTFSAGASVAGALLQIEEDTGAAHFALGTWAVTAP